MHLQTKYSVVPSGLAARERHPFTGALPLPVFRRPFGTGGTGASSVYRGAAPACILSSLRDWRHGGHPFTGALPLPVFCRPFGTK